MYCLYEAETSGSLYTYVYVYMIRIILDKSRGRHQLFRSTERTSQGVIVRARSIDF